MVPHVDVHGRRYHDRSGRCQIQRSQKISGHALRELGQDVGGCGSDQQGIDGLSDGYVLDGRINIRLNVAAAIALTSGEHVGNDFFAGKCGKGQRPHEFLRSPSHDDLNPDAAFLQQADNLCRLVRCNAATNSEGYFHTYL